jgi:hypothetical protein
MTLRRTLVFAFGASLAWSLEVLVWGGFLIRIGPFKISSRHYEPPLLLALVCLAAAFTPIGSGGRRAVMDEWQWWRQRVLRYVAAPLRRLFDVARPAVQSALDLGLRLLRHAPSVAPMVLIALVAAGVVVRWMPARSFWLDEETIAINLRDRSFGHLAGALWFGQSAPYGWMAAERVAILVAGTREQVLRLLPMLCFVATMVVAWATGRRWLNSVGTLVFVSCSAFSGWTVHYAFEAKPYTADALGALAVSVLAVWTLDADPAMVRQRRVWIWWSAAAVALWFANGALLAAPGCAAIVLLSTWRRDGPRAALRAAAGGLIWLASFAACYLCSLRFTVGSQYLYDYWHSALPPAGSGPIDRFLWLGQQLQPLAENPGSTTTGVLLWVVFVAGVLTSRRPRLAMVAAAAPLTAFALGWFRLVPLHDRVALWMTPLVYLGVALLADRAAEWAAHAWRRRTWRLLSAALAAAIGSGWIAVNLAQHADGFLAPRDQDTPDRGDAAAVRWMFAARTPGDVIVTTHQGWPAIWWYGSISPGDESASTLELTPHVNSACDEDLGRTIARSRRTLIFVGFPDVPPTFLTDLQQVIEGAGRTIAIASFEPGRVWIVEPRAADSGTADTASGCMPVRPATRW